MFKSYINSLEETVQTLTLHIFLRLDIGPSFKTVEMNTIEMLVPWCWYHKSNIITEWWQASKIYQNSEDLFFLGGGAVNLNILISIWTKFRSIVSGLLCLFHLQDIQKFVMLFDISHKQFFGEKSHKSIVYQTLWAISWAGSVGH